MQHIILASQSSARKEIFSSLGIPFIVKPAQIDEKLIRDEDLSVRVLRIATTKAEKIEKENKDAIIISADTFSAIGKKVFEKPADSKEAAEMLKYLSGKKAKNYTGFCYIDNEKGIRKTVVKITSYQIRELYPHEIELYVNKYPVTQWAAGFALVFPYIMGFIGEMSGSLTSMAYGLPIEELLPLLKKSGFQPNP